MFLGESRRGQRSLGLGGFLYRRGEVDAEVVPSMASVGMRRGGEVVSEGVLGRAWSQAHLMELLSALDG